MLQDAFVAKGEILPWRFSNAHVEIKKSPRREEMTSLRELFFS